MNFQQIYNATYNHFAGKELWPQYIPYNPEWEFSPNDSIKNVFDSGKRDGTIEKINNELKGVQTNESYKKVKRIK